MTEREKAVADIMAILQPFKGTGYVDWDDPDCPNTFTPDEPVRDIVRDALRKLDIDGLGGCRLCAS